MKTFTARQLNQDRQEIRQAIQDGGCIVQFKHSDRSIDFEAVILPMENFEKLFEYQKMEKVASQLEDFMQRRDSE